MLLQMQISAGSIGTVLLQLPASFFLIDIAVRGRKEEKGFMQIRIPFVRRNYTRLLSNPEDPV